VIVTVANLKGGVAKTTTAVILAEAAASRGETVLLVDADPQGSATRWAATAELDGGPGLRAKVIPLGTVELERRLAAIAGDFAHVVIDTPPGDLGIVRAAIRAGDVVLVPCQPALMDLDRLSPTLDLATEAGKPAAVVLTRCRANTLSLAGARDALDNADLPVLSSVIPQREQIAAEYGERPGWLPLALYGAVLIELESALS